jgi:hypothetical protein
VSRGLLDTSVVIDLDDPAVALALDDVEIAVSAITLAELAAGPPLAATLVERARRQARLQQIEATLEPIAFDAEAARSYGLMVASVTESGRSHRPRVADLLIAATAHAAGLVLYTRNADDLSGLADVLTVIVV